MIAIYRLLQMASRERLLVVLKVSSDRSRTPMLCDSSRTQVGSRRGTPSNHSWNEKSLMPLPDSLVDW